MSYWRAYYHLIWATKNREPWITPERMDLLQQSFRVVAKDMGAYTHVIGGIADHVHVAVSIPPTIAVSDYVGRLKGGSNRLIDKTIKSPDDLPFFWQSQYGMLTFVERSFPDIVSYIENQASRHATNDLWPTFEEIPDQVLTK